MLRPSVKPNPKHDINYPKHNPQQMTLCETTDHRRSLQTLLHFRTAINTLPDTEFHATFCDLFTVLKADRKRLRAKIRALKADDECPSEALKMRRDSLTAGLFEYMRMWQPFREEEVGAIRQHGFTRKILSRANTRMFRQGDYEAAEALELCPLTYDNWWAEFMDIGLYCDVLVELVAEAFPEVA